MRKDLDILSVEAHIINLHCTNPNFFDHIPNLFSVVDLEIGTVMWIRKEHLTKKTEKLIELAMHLFRLVYDGTRSLNSLQEVAKVKALPTAPVHTFHPHRCRSYQFYILPLSIYTPTLCPSI